MPEVPDTRKGHCHAKPVGCLNYFGVPYRPPGLDDRRCAGLGNGLKAVGEWKKGVGGGNRSLQGKNGLHRAKPGSVDPAHLPCANPHRLAVALTEAGVDDRV